jgi:hypothetical protein
MEKEKQMPVEEAPSSKQKFSFKKSKPHIKPEKKPYIEKTLHGLWKSNEFDFQIRGIASGDIDGDQNQELVVISEKDIYFFRFINGRMQSFHEIKGKRYFNLISISIGDINENGKAEIFVSNILTNNSRLNSSVLEWNGNGFDTIYIHSDWYYRVIRKDKKDILLGQKRGYESEIFTGPVYEMDYDSNGYSPAREILLPRKINLYMINSGDAFNDARNLFFTPSANNDRILILNESGQEQWSLPYPYGSKSVSIESAGFKYGKKDYYPIPLPAFIEDINNDGKNEVLVVQNTDLKVHFLKPAKTADAFHSEIFEGKKNGLELIFKTKDIEGYLSDYALADIDNDGKKELLCAVFIKTGRIMKKDNSFIVIHDLIKEE